MCQSRIAVLETDVAAARAEITSLRAAVAAQDGSLSQLQARVCGLEQQLQVRLFLPRQLLWSIVLTSVSFRIFNLHPIFQTSQEDNASKASLISQATPHNPQHTSISCSAFHALIAFQISSNDDAHTCVLAASSHHCSPRCLHQRSRGSSSLGRAGTPQAAQHGAGAQRCNIARF